MQAWVRALKRWLDTRQVQVRAKWARHNATAGRVQQGHIWWQVWGAGLFTVVVVRLRLAPPLAAVSQPLTLAANLSDCSDSDADSSGPAPHAAAGHAGGTSASSDDKVGHCAGGQS